MTTRITKEEDCATLSFGEEFNTSQPLLLSEVKVLLQLRELKTTIQQQTNSYTTLFSKFTNKQTVKKVRQLFVDYHEFEMAMLCNLCIESTQEALQLIPSLQRVNEDELQSKLNELIHLQKYQ
jgi:hypothetical protein